MKLTTSDLDFKFYQIFKDLEESEGVMTPELEEALAINENDFEERVDNYFGIVSQNEGDIEKLSKIKQDIERKISIKTKANAYIEQIIKDTLIKSTPATITASGAKSYKREFPNLQISISATPRTSVDIIKMSKIEDAGLGKYEVDFETNDTLVVNKIRELFPNLQITKNFKPDKVTIGNKLKAKELVEGAELATNYSFKFK